MQVRSDSENGNKEEGNHDKALGFAEMVYYFCWWQSARDLMKWMPSVTLISFVLVSTALVK